ncbi:unnamed protein product [Lota lota]
MCRFFFTQDIYIQVLQNWRVQFMDILSKKLFWSVPILNMPCSMFGGHTYTHFHFACLHISSAHPLFHPPHSPTDFSPGIYAKHALVSLAEAERGDGLADHCK